MNLRPIPTPPSTLVARLKLHTLHETSDLTLTTLIRKSAALWRNQVNTQ
jgi:hypothetical protein